MDFERLLRETRRSLEAMRGRPEQAAEALPVRGTGEAYEGQVRAVATDGRLEQLELDSRLLRMPPDQLAPHIVAAANAALDDLRAKAPADDPGPVVDPGVLAERLGEVTNEGLMRMAVISQGLTDTIARISSEAHVSGDPGDHGLEDLLTQARRSVETVSSPGAAVDVRGQATDSEGQIRATVGMSERIEVVEIAREAMRAASFELGERVVTAVNGALEDVGAKVREQVGVRGQDDFAARVQAVQDLSLQHMRAYGQALAALMSSIERR